MLTPMDDFLLHQAAETLDHPATSDRNFYDRYYFSAFVPDGSAFVAVAFGQYPNLNVTDAFANAVVDGRQYIVRASRELDGDRGNTAIGPIRVEVLDGLRRLRVTCQPNEWNLDFDLTFEARSQPYEEPRFYRRAGPRVVQDYIRYTQTGRWRGTLRAGDRTFAVEPESWYGARDRSWGVRPVGEPIPGGAPTARGTFYWNWAPIQFAEHTLLYTVSEDENGVRWHESVVLLPHADVGAVAAVASAPSGSAAPASGEVVHMHDIRHEWQFQPGTRIFNGGRLSFRDPSNRQYMVAVRPVGPVWHMFGGGYGPPWRHGVYQGPLAVDGDLWDLSSEEVVRTVSGLDETLCAFEMEGDTGYGPFEFACFGPYRPYGFA